MRGVYLKFYVHELRKHHGVLLYEWLLDEAKKIGIHGGSAFRAIAGFGRHGVLREHFFELAGDLPVNVEFVISEDEAQQLLALVRAEKIHVFYIMTPVEYDILEGKGA